MMKKSITGVYYCSYSYSLHVKFEMIRWEIMVNQWEIYILHMWTFFLTLQHIATKYDHLWVIQIQKKKITAISEHVRWLGDNLSDGSVAELKWKEINTATAAQPQLFKKNIFFRC